MYSSGKSPYGDQTLIVLTRGKIGTVVATKEKPDLLSPPTIYIHTILQTFTPPHSTAQHGQVGRVSRLVGSTRHILAGGM